MKLHKKFCTLVGSWALLSISLAAFLLSSAAASTAPTGSSSKGKPIMLSHSGGFEIGGTVIMNGANANETLSCDHGYMEYFIPWTPRRTSLVLWHSSSTQVFQNTWSGGPGYKDLFLRQDYPIYLWDGPRVGRANWACVPITYYPFYRDAGNFVGWNFGPSFLNFWPGSQFAGRIGSGDNGSELVDSEVRAEAWKQAVRKRYDEFDTDENVLLHAQTAALAADSGKAGDNIVYVTNSAAGLRAQLTATLSTSTNIKGIVAYESIGYVLPASVNLTEYGLFKTPGFGPFVVSDDQFARLKGVKVQFVWGDHRAEGKDFLGQHVMQSRLVAELINGLGGQAEVLMLGNGTGLSGNTHIAFADENNEEVAGLMGDWLGRMGLDGYAEEREEGK